MQWQIPINVVVNVKHGRWNCCPMDSQRFTQALLVSRSSPGGCPLFWAQFLQWGLINKLHSLYSYWLMNRIGDIFSVIITFSSSVYYHADNFLKLLHFCFGREQTIFILLPLSLPPSPFLCPSPSLFYQSVFHLLTYLLSSSLARLSPFSLYFP